MDERRKLKRKYLMFYTRVFDLNTGKLLGYLSDLTAAGTMIISEEPIQPDTKFRLSIDLPEDFYSKQRLKFEARSVWCEADVNPKFYNTGFQLLDVTPEDVEIIERLVADFGLRE